MTSPIGSVPPLDWPHYGIGFVPAVKRAFQKYATFSGRASRSEFWWWFLANAIIGMILYLLFLALAFSSGRPGEIAGIAWVPMVLLIIYSLAVIVPNIAVTVRRLHDAGFSGWFYLFSVVGLGIVVIILCALETSPKAVQYGPPAPEGYAPGAFGSGQPGYAPPPGTPTS
jgi:uncharacterized membrane protein YhaH (DUF805 family)